MIFWMFSAITLSSAIVATFSSHLRVAFFALWVAGLSAGGIYLSLGAELLAIVQWIVSTVIALIFIFYSVLLGEYSQVDNRTKMTKFLTAMLPVIAGSVLTATIWFSARQLPHAPNLNANQSPNVATMGKVIATDNILSLEILALTLFLVILGSGIVIRMEKRE